MWNCIHDVTYLLPLIEIGYNHKYTPPAINDQKLRKTENLNEKYMTQFLYFKAKFKIGYLLKN